jgi:hypothetical protein
MHFGEGAFRLSAKLSISLLIVMAFAPSLNAADSEFLSEGPYVILASAYAEAQARLSKKGVPTEILENRMREGMAKRVPPDRLLGILPLDEARLSGIADCLTAGEMDSLAHDARLKLYKTLSLVTTGIITLETLEAYVRAIPPGAASAPVLGAWAETCISLYNLSSLDDGEMRALGVAILGRGFKPPVFAILPGLFLKSRRNGLSDQDALMTMMRTLGRGGSVFQIEDELSRRRGP